jgi:hypothetical protein
MRFLIVSEKHGFFLGVQPNAVFGSLLGEKESSYVIFAKENPYQIVAAVSFEHEAQAQYYIDAYLNKIYDDLKIVSLNTSHKHVNVVDLIKAGFESYTHSMMDSLPMLSETIH